MAEPKKRLTSTRSGQRQSHDSLKKISYIFCPNCKSAKLKHSICLKCGIYKNKKIIPTKEDRLKQSKIKKELKDE